MATAPRATWKGFLKLSLVSCPVRLYTATSKSDRINFNMLHKDTHNRVQMKPHDPELGEVDRADLVKGYEFDKDQYIIIENEDLEQIQIESAQSIAIESFVDIDDIEPIYLDAPYYIVPDGPIAEETFQVIQRSMESKKKGAIAKVVLSGRERLVVIAPVGRGLALTTLRVSKEIRDHSQFFDELGDGELDPEMLKMAEMIIDQHSGKFDTSTFVDEYQEALLGLVKTKLKGGKPVVAKSPERGNVINLMDALKRSLADSETKPPAKSKKRAPAKKGARSAK